MSLWEFSKSEQTQTKQVECCDVFKMGKHFFFIAGNRGNCFLGPMFCFFMFFVLEYYRQLLEEKKWHANRVATPYPVLIIHPWFAATGKLIILSGGREVKGDWNFCQFACGCVPLPWGNHCTLATQLLTDYGKTMKVRRLQVFRSSTSILDTLRNAQILCRLTYRVILLVQCWLTLKAQKGREVNNMAHSRGAAFCWERLEILWMFLSLQSFPSLFHTE